MKPGQTGLTRLFNATLYSWQGLKAAYKNEAAFRQELAACLVLFPFAFWLANNALELVILISSLFLVLICEIVNSAIEATIDRFGDEVHLLAGRAKDMGSAAVFLALLNASICWLIIGFNF